MGILLALPIDGWRDERENREQEAYYLARLADEFRYNAEDAEPTEPGQIRWLPASVGVPVGSGHYNSGLNSRSINKRNRSRQ